MTQKIELTDLSEYELEIQKVYEELASLEQENRIVTNAEELEELEQEIRRQTDQLGSLLLGKKFRSHWIHLRGRPQRKNW